MLPAGHPAYPRVHAPLVQRRTSRFAQRLSRRGQGKHPAGIRAWSDDAVGPGHLLEVDVLLGDHSLVSTVVEVEWCDEQPRGAPARFDVGLRFVVARRMDLERLEPVLAAG